MRGRSRKAVVIGVLAAFVSVTPFAVGVKHGTVKNRYVRRITVKQATAVADSNVPVVPLDDFRANFGGNFSSNFTSDFPSNFSSDVGCTACF